MSALLLLGIAVLELLEGVFVKHYSSKHEKGGFLFTALLCFFSMLTFAVSEKDGFHVPPTLWMYAIIAGGLYCLSSILTYIALGCGSFAISMLILSYSLVFSIGYGLFFLNESATAFTYLGIALIMVSLYLTGKKKKDLHAQRQKVSLKWAICIGLSMFGSGMFSVLCRMQQVVFDNCCTGEFMVIALGFSAVILFVIGLIKDGRDFGYILKHGAIWTALAGCANGAGNMLTLVLHTRMPISISTPVKAGTKIVLSFVISMLIFREKFDKRQLLGVLLGAGAVVLLNL